jgi:hypothetical protein
MPSSVINSDDGVISGTSGLKSSGGDDGNLVFQSKGTETARINTDKQIVAAAGTASLPALTTTGDLNTGIFFPAADTIAFAEGGAEAMRIDSSGRLGIGTTSPSAKLDFGVTSQFEWVVKTRTNANSVAAIGVNADFGMRLGAPSDVTGALISFGSISAADGSTFGEKARITSAGYFKASNNGTYNNVAGLFHEFYQSANNEALRIVNANASFSNDVFQVWANRNTTNNSFYAINYYNDAASAYKFRVADSGNVTNTNNSYGSLSDVKLKQDIVDAGSQWDDIKNLRVRKYHWKSDPNGFMQMGLVAQEAEEVSPGLVEEHPDYEEVEVTDEEGNVTKQRNDLGTVTKSVKYSVLYMKAVKALQEAMERIETLEGKNDALEARIAALEQA